MKANQVNRGQRAGMRSGGGVYVNVFTEDEFFAIHCASLEILKQVGVKVFSEKALDIFEKGGVSVDRVEKMVRIPAYLVEDAVKSAPSTILLAGRDPKNDFVVEDRRIGFVNFGEAVRVIDPATREYRESTKDDLKKIIRLTDALPELDLSYRAVASQDKPPQTQPLHNAEAVFNNTSKHFFIGVDDKNVNHLIHMASVVAGGYEQLKERPILSFIQPPISPLHYPPEFSDVIIAAARAGVPVVVVSEVMSGATSPITLAGSIAQHNAEVLGGIVLSQLAERGAPVLYGSTSHIFDMQTGAAAVGAPELSLLSSGLACMAKHYRLPCMMAGG